jgi:Bacterial SH3 domain
MPADQKKRRMFMPGSMLDLDLQKLGIGEPDVVRQLREMNESIMKPFREHERMMRDLIAPLEQSRALMNASSGMTRLIDEMNRTSKIADVAMEPFRRQQKMVDDMLAAFRPQTSVFHEMALAAAFRPSAAERILQDAAQVLESFSIDRVTPTSVVINGDEVTFAEAEVEVQRAWTNNAALPPNKRVTATAKDLEQSSAHPIVRVLLLMFLTYVLGAMFESPIQTVTDPVTIPQAKRVVEWLQKNVPAVWPTPRVFDIRVVTGKAVAVRECDRRNSAQRGSLDIGDEVVVLEKRKDWMRVVAMDDEDLRGWVFSRYIKKVRLRDVEQSTHQSFSPRKQ